MSTISIDIMAVKKKVVHAREKNRLAAVDHPQGFEGGVADDFQAARA